MFERFTDRARRIMVLADEVSREHHHNYIGTEHLLVSLAREDGGVAGQVLRDLDFTPEGLNKRATDLAPDGEVSPRGHIPFTPRAKKALELSLREALQLGHNYIGTEHLLLGIIREGEGRGAQILLESVDLNEVRRAVITTLSGEREVEEVVPAPPKPTGPRGDETAKAVMHRLATGDVDGDDLIITTQGNDKEQIAALLRSNSGHYFRVSVEKMPPTNRA